MSLKIGPISFALTDTSLSGGRRWKEGEGLEEREGGKVQGGTIIYIFHSNRVIIIISPGELVTRLFTMRRRSHPSLCAAFTVAQIIRFV